MDMYGMTTAKKQRPGGFCRDKCSCCDDDVVVDGWLDPCCANELRDRKAAAEVLRVLRANDPVRKAEERLNVLAAVVSEAPPTRVEQPVYVVEEEDEDDDDEYSDLDEEENLLMEKLRETRIRELESGRRVVRDVYDAKDLASGTVIAHVYDHTAARLDVALERIALDNATVKFCRLSHGLASELAERVRVPSDAVAVFRDGRVAALADAKNFFDSDTVAEDALLAWLDRAGVFDEPHRVLPEDAELDEQLDEEVFFPCGKPGCNKPFQHHHIGPAFAAPREWQVDAPPLP